MKIMTRCAMLLVLACAPAAATPANRLFSDAELIAEYATRPSMFVTIDGVRIHYRDEGRGPTLVLINGHLGSLHMWDAWVERLRDRFRIVRLDFPPYGLSGPDPENLYSSQRAAGLVGRFLDHLGLARVHIGGTSNGALVAVLFAIDNPERVDRVVVSTLPAGRPPPRTPSPALIAAATADRATAPVQSRAFYEAFLRDIIANDAVIDDALIDRYWKLNNRVGARAAEATYIQAQYRFWDSTDVKALYARLRRPLLLQWGADGVVLPEKIGADVAALLPNAPVTLIQYRGAGHLPMVEKPDETARDAAAFLTETRSSKR